MGSPSWAIFYVHVADVAEAVAKAVELGATVAIPLIDNGQIRFAHLLDPAGRRFAVWTPNS
ncbi:VOC family protein [Naasia lichenicola]|uniref:VOC family protein n=1 Tax=Naasia lichenicola TaxID=2565933 RepID=UPI0018EE9000|nr:VOC family protein [Naasia lichenicola]